MRAAPLTPARHAHGDYADVGRGSLRERQK